MCGVDVCVCLCVCFVFSSFTLIGHTAYTLEICNVLKFCSKLCIGKMWTNCPGENVDELSRGKCGRTVQGKIFVKTFR